MLGVNTAIRCDDSGMGFAVPTEVVSSIVPELIADGEILRPKLDITVDVFDEPADGVERERLRVLRAGAGGAVRAGDAPVSLGDQTIEDRGALFGVVRQPLFGLTGPVTVERDGHVCTVDLIAS